MVPMEWLTVLVSLVLFYLAWKISQNRNMDTSSKKMTTTILAITGIALLVFGTPIYGYMRGALPLTVAAPNNGPQNPPLSYCGDGVCNVGETYATCPADCKAPATANQQPISTFKVQLREEYSNSYTSVGGTLKIYDQNADPADPSAQVIDSITVTSGVASDTSVNLMTDTPYRVVFDGAGTYYDYDFGVISFPYQNYQKSTGEYLFAPNVAITKIASIDDFLSEESTTGIVNGESSPTGAVELIGNATANSLTYDESVGDENFYIEPTLGVSGGNEGIKDFVMCFRWDETNPPEGNEITALTFQQVSGTSFPIPSNLLPYWTSQSCVLLGKQVMGGTSEEIKLSFTVNEDNLDTNDDWTIRVDDLGDYLGKDICLNTGASTVTENFDAQA